MLDWMAELGYVGTELGPPGYLGDGPRSASGSTRRGLALVGAFLPQHFSRDELVERGPRLAAPTRCALVREATPDGSPSVRGAVPRPSTSRCGSRCTGRIDRHPEAQLDAPRWERARGQPPRRRRAVPRARASSRCSTRTPARTSRPPTRSTGSWSRIDPSLVGSASTRAISATAAPIPARAIRDYAALIRHVHLKDCRLGRPARCRGARGRPRGGAPRRASSAARVRARPDIDAVVDALREIGYDGWLVVEQDQFLTARDTRESLVAGQRANREYLARLGV